LRLEQDEGDQADLEEDGCEGIYFLRDAHGLFAVFAALPGRGGGNVGGCVVTGRPYPRWFRS
jgi:hypothetical protein